LTRKPEHQAVIIYEVEEKFGGRVEAALAPLDRDDIASRTTRGILAVVAEAERLNAVARMLRGRHRRAERGQLMGSSNPTFGYAWADDERGKRTTYAIDPVTGPIVQRIFQLVLSGYAFRMIARLFNAEGVPTPARWAERCGHLGRRPVGDSWHIEMIRRMVYDQTYTGEKVAYAGQKDPVVIQVPALIDKETLELAHMAIQARDRNGRTPIDKEAAWLRGHVWCGVCGARAIIIRSKEKRDLLRNARKRAMQTQDEDLAQQSLQEAEELNASIHTLEQEYADAREMLDNFNAGNAWIESTLKRIYEHNPIREIPTVEDIKAFPYEERWLLLAATGLKGRGVSKRLDGEAGPRVL
jgi:Recombinase